VSRRQSGQVGREQNKGSGLGAGSEDTATRTLCFLFTAPTIACNFVIRSHFEVPQSQEKLQWW
jgi:hypothetical protein